MLPGVDQVCHHYNHCSPIKLGGFVAARKGRLILLASLGSCFSTSIHVSFEMFKY